ncbi:hypothetical protein TcWFU_007615 [Taenia crassiceps]|uniref:Uncharacterized protein n=1 Tax=Taenia crassiceps TaxID=6207 RepID=A0ABR4Q2S1_9CEST
MCLFLYQANVLFHKTLFNRLVVPNKVNALKLKKRFNSPVVPIQVFSFAAMLLTLLKFWHLKVRLSLLQENALGLQPRPSGPIVRKEVLGLQVKTQVNVNASEKTEKAASLPSHGPSQTCSHQTVSALLSPLWDQIWCTVNHLVAPGRSIPPSACFTYL